MGGAILAVAILACAKSEPRKDTAASTKPPALSDSTAVHTTSGAGNPGDEESNDQQTDPDQGTSPLPAGTLPNGKHIEDYKNDASHFWIFAKGKGWNGWKRQRKCKENAACDNDALATKMHIQAIRDANTVRIKALPANGVVIGRMMNVGAYKDKTTETPGGQTVPDQYYYIIEKVDDVTATLKVAILSFEQRAGRHIPTGPLVIKTAKYAYHPCGSDLPSAVAVGDFKNCLRVAGTATSGPEAEMEKATTADAFAWFSCAEGCCSAQYPPLLVPPVAAKASGAPTK